MLELIHVCSSTYSLVRSGIAWMFRSEIQHKLFKKDSEENKTIILDDDEVFKEYMIVAKM
jgi:hypothetical protein